MCGDAELESIARHLDRSPSPQHYWFEAVEPQERPQSVRSDPGNLSPEDGPWSGRPSSWRGINDKLDMCEGEPWYDGCLEYLLLDGPPEFQMAYHHAMNFIISNCTQGIFKIGITAHPRERWWREDCGYEWELGYSRMKIIWVAKHSLKDIDGSTGAMETLLTTVFNEKTYCNCQNKEGAGGLGAPKGTPQFCYVAW